MREGYDSFITLLQVLFIAGKKTPTHTYPLTQVCIHCLCLGFGRVVSSTNYAGRICRNFEGSSIDLEGTVFPRADNDPHHHIHCELLLLVTKD